MCYSIFPSFAGFAFLINKSFPVLITICVEENFYLMGFGREFWHVKPPKKLILIFNHNFGR